MIDKTVFSVNIWDVFQKEGKAALEKGDLDTAATDFKRALEKAERFGPTDPRIATSKRYLADVYHKQGKDDEAEAMFKEALELLENELGYDSNALVKTLIAYKNLLQDQGRDGDVEDINSRLQAIRPVEQDLSDTTDVFEVEIPAHPETEPMTPEQQARIQELLKKNIPEDLKSKADSVLSGEPTFKVAFELEDELRKAIVESYNGGGE